MNPLDFACLNGRAASTGLHGASAKGRTGQTANPTNTGARKKARGPTKGDNVRDRRVPLVLAEGLSLSDIEVASVSHLSLPCFDCLDGGCRKDTPRVVLGRTPHRVRLGCALWRRVLRSANFENRMPPRRLLKTMRLQQFRKLSLQQLALGRIYCAWGRHTFVVSCKHYAP